MKDSINISINQIDSISDLIKLHIIKESYFSDIISHQGNMLALQTGIFSVIVAVVIALSAFFTFQSFNKKLKEITLNLEKIQYTFYKGKVVVDETGNKYYIELSGEYHLLPDSQTALQFRTTEGFVNIFSKDLKSQYTEGDKLESILDGKIIELENSPDIYIIINNRKIHIPNMAILVDLGRSLEERKRVSQNELKKIGSWKWQY